MSKVDMNTVCQAQTTTIQPPHVLTSGLENEENVMVFADVFCIPSNYSTCFIGFYQETFKGPNNSCWTCLHSVSSHIMSLVST